jgi:hypothetical protein
MGLALLRTALLREMERELLSIARLGYRPHPVRYRSHFSEDELDFADFDLQNDNHNLLALLLRVVPLV